MPGMKKTRSSVISLYQLKCWITIVRITQTDREEHFQQLPLFISLLANFLRVSLLGTTIAQ